MFRLWETVEDHSGYILPWYFNPTSLIPFWGGASHRQVPSARAWRGRSDPCVGMPCTGADHHDFHHEHFDGNYADVFIIWDRVFGTDTKWREQKSIGRLNNKGRAEFEASLRAGGGGDKGSGDAATAEANGANGSASHKTNGSNGSQLRQRPQKR